MPNLQGTVGAGGGNAVHDVSLVQVMLHVVKNAKGQAYYTPNYTGTYGDDVKTAIIAFQTDKGIIAPPPVKGKAVPPPVIGVNETPGLVGPNSKTYQTLIQNLPAAYSRIRAMPNLKTIYLEALDAEAAVSAGQINGNAGLIPTFRANVANLVNAFQRAHKIAIWVEPNDGWNRGFEQQADIVRRGKTKAGPGESNHNWGFAVDIGFKGFKWLAGDTSIVTDDYWLQRLAAAKAAEPTTLWSTRNAIAAGFGLHKSGWKVDLIHIQGFDDSNVNMPHSLAAQLTRVGKFKWTREGEYKTDMGSGGTPEGVGTAYHLWTKESHPSKSLVSAWKNAQEKADWAKLPANAKDKLNQAALAALKLAPGAKAPVDPGLKAWKETDITPELLIAAKAALRAEMEAAESKRDQWKPAP